MTYLHIHTHDGAVVASYRLRDDFEESKVKRGQPENAGQFAKQHAEYHEKLTKSGYEHKGGGRYEHPADPAGTHVRIGEGHWAIHRGSKRVKGSEGQVYRQFETPGADLNYELGGLEEKREKLAKGFWGTLKPTKPAISQPAKATSQEQEAISAYLQPGEDTTRGPYERLNTALREDKPLTGDLKGIAEGMDSFIARSKTTKPVVVYRGLNMDIGKLTPGSVVRNAGFASSSSDPDIAEQFAENQGGPGNDDPNKHPLKMVVTVPAGSSLMSAQLATERVLGESYDGYKGDEKEYIFPRGSHFRVDHVDPRTNVARVTLITDEPHDARRRLARRYE